MTYKIVVISDEIDSLLNEIAERQDMGGSRFRGGIHAGIEWLIGLTDEYPYSEK